MHFQSLCTLSVYLTKDIYTKRRLLKTKLLGQLLFLKSEDNARPFSRTLLINSKTKITPTILLSSSSSFGVGGRVVVEVCFVCFISGF